MSAEKVMLGEERQAASAALLTLRGEPRFGVNIALEPRWVATWLWVFGGRLASIWLPLFLLSDPGSASSRSAILAVLPALAWALAAESFLRSTPRPLRAAQAASIVGPATVVLVFGASAWLQQWHSAVAAVTFCAVGTAVAAATFEAILVRVLRKSRVLVVGSDGDTRSLQEHCDRTQDAAYAVVGTMRCQGARTAPVEQAREALAAAAEVGADMIVIADEAVYDSAISLVLDKNMPLRVIGHLGFYENAFWFVPLQLLSAKWFACLVHIRQSPPERPSKRIFDLVTASCGLLVAAPLFPLIALLISTTPGPVIYRQTRIGRAGKSFTIYKFRTMITGAERDGKALLATPYDTRLTRIGSILRRMHLDELPQLWNVLRGEMSLVGPRPERKELIETLEVTIPFWNRRLLTRPGVTGWAQLRCGYASDTNGMVRKLSHDLWYVRHQSLRLDLALCVQTMIAACAEAFGRFGRSAPSPSDTSLGTIHGTSWEGTRSDGLDAALPPGGDRRHRSRDRRRGFSPAPQQETGEPRFEIDFSSDRAELAADKAGSTA